MDIVNENLHYNRFIVNCCCCVLVFENRYSSNKSAGLSWIFGHCVMDFPVHGQVNEKHLTFLAYFKACGNKKLTLSRGRGIKLGCKEIA